MFVFLLLLRLSPGDYKVRVGPGGGQMCLHVALLLFAGTVLEFCPHIWKHVVAPNYSQVT